MEELGRSNEDSRVSRVFVEQNPRDVTGTPRSRRVGSDVGAGELPSW
jgi:hypothetical protein